MEYRKTVLLKDGRECVIRHGTPEDAQAALDCFLLTHDETDFLSSRPGETSLTAEKEARFLLERAESPDEAELAAVVDGRIVGLAGVDRISPREKLRHRANFGISIERAYWGLGIGREMLRACIECAERAGYAQLELEVVADNRRALALYESEGFTEYGRNPMGFRSPETGRQALVLMRRELGNSVPV